MIEEDKDKLIETLTLQLQEKEKEIERLNNLYPLNEEKVKQIAVE